MVAKRKPRGVTGTVKRRKASGKCKDFYGRPVPCSSKAAVSGPVTYKKRSK